MQLCGILSTSKAAYWGFFRRLENGAFIGRRPRSIILLSSILGKKIRLPRIPARKSGDRVTGKSRRSEKLRGENRLSGKWTNFANVTRAGDDRIDR